MMIKKIILFCSLLSFVCSFSVIAQRVGVVLSGGGAKGLTHIGVLKALEENEIPVDYIIGTSMGGVVGGLYSAGHSPVQIEQMVTSKEFMEWIDGKINPNYDFFFTKEDIKLIIYSY
jgi:NTE family protein